MQSSGKSLCPLAPPPAPLTPPPTSRHAHRSTLLLCLAQTPKLALRLAHASASTQGISPAAFLLIYPTFPGHLQLTHRLLSPELTPMFASSPGKCGITSIHSPVLRCEILQTVRPVSQVYRKTLRGLHWRPLTSSLAFKGGPHSARGHACLGGPL